MQWRQSALPTMTKQFFPEVCANQMRRHLSGEPHLLHRWSHCSLLASKETIDQQHDDRSYDGTNETGAFARFIPAEGLPEIGGNERTHDAQNGRHDKP